jgi:hypothetical protein
LIDPALPMITTAASLLHHSPGHDRALFARVPFAAFLPQQEAIFNLALLCSWERQDEFKIPITISRYSWF